MCRRDRDATVNWGGPDFSFRNDYNQPILIRAHTLPGRVQISISSSDHINFKARHVPGAAEAIPEEIETNTNVGKELP